MCYVTRPIVVALIAMAGVGADTATAQCCKQCDWSNYDCPCEITSEPMTCSFVLADTICVGGRAGTSTTAYDNDCWVRDCGGEADPSGSDDVVAYSWIIDDPDGAAIPEITGVPCDEGRHLELTIVKANCPVTVTLETDDCAGGQSGCCLPDDPPCQTDPQTIVGYCGIIQGIGLSKPRICPGGRTKVMIKTTCEWDLPVFGAEPLDPNVIVEVKNQKKTSSEYPDGWFYNADIVASPDSASGKVLVWAQGPEGCYEETILKVGCTSCGGGSCDTGTGTADMGTAKGDPVAKAGSGYGPGTPGAPGGPQVMISLGNLPNGESAGALGLMGLAGDDHLADPRWLSCNAPGSVQRTYVSDDYQQDPNAPDWHLHSIELPGEEVWITSLADGADGVTNKYKIEFLRDNGYPTWEEHSAWLIEQFAPSDPNYENGLRITHADWIDVSEQPQGVREIHTYLYDADPQVGDAEWKFVAADGVSDLSATIQNWDQTTLTRTRVTVQDGGTYASVSEQFTEFLWGLGLTTKSVDVGSGSPLVTTYEYYNTSSGLAVADRLKRVNAPDGNWVAYEYDYQYNAVTGADDRILTTYRPWLDETEPGTLSVTSTALAATVTHYHADTWRLLERREYAAGQLVGTTTYTHAFHQSGNLASTEERRCADANCNSYLTTTTYYEDDPNEVVEYIVYPDSRQDVYDLYVDIDFVGSATNPQVLLAQSGDYSADEVVHAGPSGAVVASKSTKQIVVRDHRGRTVFRESYLANSSSAWVRTDWTWIDYDDAQDARTIYRSDGTSSYHVGCCGADTVTDPFGVVESTEKDELGRISLRTRDALPAYTGGGVALASQPTVDTEYTYSIANSRRIITVNVDPGGDPNLATHRELDLVGRLVSETDVSGLETTYVYDDDGNDHQRVTKTLPGGATEIKTYYKDGRLLSITGTAVVSRYYYYGSGSNQRWAITYTGAEPSNYAQPGADDRYTKTTYDMLGRVATEEGPGWVASGSTTLTTTNYYNAATGRLEKVTSTGRPPMHYAYDTMGDVIRSGIDVNATPNGLELGGDDRITETETVVSIPSGESDYWRTTISYVYGASGSSNKTVSSISMTLLQLPADGELLGETRSIDSSGAVVTTTRYRREFTSGGDTYAYVETVTAYDDGTSDASVSYNGLVQQTVSRADEKYTYTYDGHGRPLRTTGPHTTAQLWTETPWTENVYGNGTTVPYAQLWKTEQQVGHPGHIVTTYGYNAAGRVEFVSNHYSKLTYYAYNDRGQLTHTWGDVPYPTKIDYDAFGQRTSLSTYRYDDGSTWNGVNWPTGPSPDETEWRYHNATGLLEEKEYDSGPLDSTVEYTYTADGKLQTRTWARDVVTTYIYADGTGGTLNTGELVKVDYGDNTTDVEYSYKRHGGYNQIIDDVGTRTFVYDLYLRPQYEQFASGSLYGNQSIKPLYEAAGTGKIAGRFAGLGVASSAAAPETLDVYRVDYTYAGGLLSTVAGPGLPSGGAKYNYVTDTSLLDNTEYLDGTDPRARTDYDYLAKRALVESVENIWIAGDTTETTVSKYTCGYDDLNRRTFKARDGAAFSAAYWEDFSTGYNDRNELTATTYHAAAHPTTNPQTSGDFAFAYDAIGNRKTYDDNPTGRDWEYTANSLNQYPNAISDDSPRIAQGMGYDADGNLIEEFVLADVSGDNVINFGDIDPFNFAILNSEEDFNTQYPNGNYWAADANGDGLVNFGDIDQFTAILFGGYSSSQSLTRLLTYDAENRLITVAPRGTAATDDVRVTFTYDHQGRRVRKLAERYNGTGWDTVGDRRFLWSGWLCLVESGQREVSAGATPVVLETFERDYTWGRDLSGSLQGAGGIGGLLAMADDHATPATTGDDLTYVCFYDVNGNVGQLVDLTPTTWSAGVMTGRYEYSPFGKLLASSGGYADENPFRFSTKYLDGETGLSYFGYRCYSARLGRWVNRDVLGEAAAQNAYAYINNYLFNAVDPDGRRIEILLPPANGETLPTYPGRREEATNQVCCRYYDRRLTPPDTWWHRHSQETICCAGKSPWQACKCLGSEGKSGTSGDARTRTLISASRGPCCSCTVYKARLKPMKWPLHQSFLIECADKSIKIDFVYLSVNTWINWSSGQAVQIWDLTVPPSQDSGWDIQDSTRIDCATTDRIIQKAQRDQASPPDYNFIHDCHWYADVLFGMALDSGIADLGNRCDD